jgi:hypothetical protein
MLMVVGAFLVALLAWGIAYIQTPISAWLYRKKLIQDPFDPFPVLPILNQSEQFIFQNKCHF